jgi:hypothetical protein
MYRQLSNSSRPYPHISTGLLIPMQDSRECSVDVIYSSLNPHFSLQLFFQQLFFHIFFPLSSLYLYSQYGTTFFYAHGIILTNLRNILSNWFFPISFYITILTAQYLPSNISYGYFVPCCIYFVHRFMIAMKYGTMSISEYS